MKKFIVLMCFVMMGSIVMAQSTDGTKSNPNQVKVEKIDMTQEVQPVTQSLSTEVGDATPAATPSNTKSAKTGKSGHKGAGCCAKKDGMSKEECMKKCSSKKKKKACGSYSDDGAL